MRKIVLPFTLLTVAVFSLPAMPAQALAARTFLSAAGSDSNNCTNVLTPCRHLATAYAATAANGEIYVLDPANYGSVTITGPVSIEGHGWASIAPVTGQAAITINANAGDKINIIGVVLDGTDIASTTGITFNSGGSLIVRDSVIRNFSGFGINFAPTASMTHFFAANTLVSDNGLTGIFISPNGSSGVTVGALDHVEMVNNGADGLRVVTSLGQTSQFTISECVVENNTDGIAVDASSGGTGNLIVQNSTIANNQTGNGISAVGTLANIRVTRTTITGNNVGWSSAPNGVTSYADNLIDGNGSANTEPPFPGSYH